MNQDILRYESKVWATADVLIGADPSDDSKPCVLFSCCCSWCEKIA
jgi:hypothetical protein